MTKEYWEGFDQGISNFLKLQRDYCTPEQIPHGYKFDIAAFDFTIGAYHAYKWASDHLFNWMNHHA